MDVVSTVKLSVLVVILSSSFTTISGTWSETPSHFQDGDIIIAGMFPLHYGTERTDNYR